MRRACAVALLVACTPASRVEVALRVPPGDAPLAMADTVSLSVRSAAGAIVALARAPASASTLVVDGVPAGAGYVVELDATEGPDVVARGASCPFTVGTSASPTVPVWFSRVGVFATTGAPRLTRDGATSFAVDGVGFVAGGSVAGQAQSSSERYAAGDGGFAVGPELAAPRANAISVAITISGGGGVLLVGGARAQDPGIELFSATRSVPQPAPFPPALVGGAGATMGDGDALIAGGVMPDGTIVGDAYVLGNGGADLQAVGGLVDARAGLTLTTIGAGHDAAIFAVGGSDATGPIADIELYDPESQAFMLATAQLLTPRSQHTTTLLPSGELLVIGGVDQNGAAVAAAELINPVTREVNATGMLGVPRSRHTATLLSSGRVLVTGGLDSSGATTATAEIFDPALGAGGGFLPTQPMTRARAGHAVVPLCDGTYLVVGGGSGAEIYNPL